MKKILLLAGMLNSLTLWAQHQIPADTLFTKDNDVPGRQYVIIRDEDKKTAVAGGDPVHRPSREISPGSDRGHRRPAAGAQTAFRAEKPAGKAGDSGQ